MAKIDQKYGFQLNIELDAINGMHLSYSETVT